MWIIISAMAHELIIPTYEEYRVIFWAVYRTFCLLVGLHARYSYYRSLSGWMILAFFFTPLAALVFLFVAGPPMEAKEQVEADLAEDLARRKKKLLEDGGEWFEAETTCKVCGNVVNLATREGIKPPVFGSVGESICQKCSSPIDTTDGV